MDNQSLVNSIINKTFEIERDTIKSLLQPSYPELEKTIDLIYNSSGRVIVTGIGKSSIVAQKFVATLSSTGTPAQYLHTTDALHGDLGVVDKKDIVIFISKSGNSQEVKDLLFIVNKMGVSSIAMTSKSGSYLSENASYIINIPISEEADAHNLVPTASIVGYIAVCDAIAMSLQELNGFTDRNFAEIHPGGMLGKQLNLTVDDLIAKSVKPSVSIDEGIQTIIHEISSKRLGACCVMDNNALVGIITDGDIRRAIQSPDFLTMRANDIMTHPPKTVSSNTLAVEALALMKNHSITQLVVVNNSNEYVGILHIHDILKEGFTMS